MEGREMEEIEQKALETAYAIMEGSGANLTTEQSETLRNLVIVAGIAHDKQQRGAA